jgi:energy-coupling factor transport system ATP-binding protein
LILQYKKINIAHYGAFAKMPAAFTSTQSSSAGSITDFQPCSLRHRRMVFPLMEIIAVQGVEFTHPSGHRAGTPAKALDKITLSIKKGDFVAILGRNGSGKSTLARLLNALYLPAAGSVCIHGIDTRDARRLWELRRITGMVFPDPDNQIVGTTVEEDVAFGPENLGLPPAEILHRVEEALQTVGLRDLAGYPPHLLTSGEKQRLALAGILAMQPECIILDEATAQLDPTGRQEVLTLLRRLNRQQGMTILHITHHMDEAGLADRVFVLDKGTLVLDGTPDAVFADVARIKELGLGLPPLTELFDLLKQDGFDLPSGMLSSMAALEVLQKIHSGRRDDGDHPH